MLVVQLLLPRFLVVEVVLFIHFVHGQACHTKSEKHRENHVGCENKSDETNATINDKSTLDRSCLVPINNGTMEWEPLFQTSNGDLILPTLIDKTPVIAIQENALISCPSAKLSSYYGGKNVMEVNCLKLTEGYPGAWSTPHRYVLQEKETQHFISSFKDLTCSRSIRESVQLLNNKTCGPSNSNGKIVQIGWRTVKGFIPQIEICHDIQKEHTFYSNHDIVGSNIVARKKTSHRRPNFKEGGQRFYAKTSASTVYKMVNQATILKKYNIIGKFKQFFLFPNHAMQI